MEERPKEEKERWVTLERGKIAHELVYLLGLVLLTIDTVLRTWKFNTVFYLL